MYVPMLRIDRWTRTTRAGNGVVAARAATTGPRESALLARFRPRPFRLRAPLSQRLTVRRLLRRRMWHTRVYVYSVFKNIMCTGTHGRYVCARGDHARESGAADKLMTSSERSALPMGNPAPSVSLARSCARSVHRTPILTVGDRETRVERELNFCLTGQSRPIARTEPSCPQAGSFARRCRGLFQIVTHLEKPNSTFRSNFINCFLSFFFNRIVLYSIRMSSCIREFIDRSHFDRKNTII